MTNSCTFQLAKTPGHPTDRQLQARIVTPAQAYAIAVADHFAKARAGQAAVTEEQSNTFPWVSARAWNAQRRLTVINLNCAPAQPATKRCHPKKAAKPTTQQTRYT